MIPYCIVTQDSTKACMVVENWIGSRIKSLNTALNKHERGRGFRVAPLGDSDSEDEGSPGNNVIENVVTQNKKPTSTADPSPPEKPPVPTWLKVFRVIVIVLCVFNLLWVYRMLTLR